ncbi:MAG TPA: DUF1549 and DUF1553 domain-containing protein [Chthonomonadaceae bacterium]|nr:DUF1549 and DUF1553 domain-containing protein [Chthonomonadaceae bacterium]
MIYRNLSSNCIRLCCLLVCGLYLALCSQRPLGATPANRVALEKYYGRFLPRRLNACTTCHLPAKGDKPPTSLADFPHNAFGHRLAVLGEELRKAGKKADIPTRLRLIATEDSDGDGVNNETELLLGHAPGDPADKPSRQELAGATKLRVAFTRFLASYRWEPFEPVHRPAVPTVQHAAWVRNPIDAFLASEQEARHLTPRPPASKAVLLRRVTLDLTGLAPTPEELRAFEQDTSPNAYEKVVDRLLASPRYGERWGRHWMDVWRYSDWAGWMDGNQIRDSQPFIWRWRDWIVESLNADQGYDRMVQEMLAADELEPDNADSLRATGFLVRNFKLLSREQWMEDTLNHTSRAFLGVTMHCAKCHNHMYDPFTQQEYYQMRAIFEPYKVRTDRLPGQPDTTKDGLVHIYDADPKVATYLFVRGDERNPDKSAVITPGIPSALGGALQITPVGLSRAFYQPDSREFVIEETLQASDTARKAAQAAQEQAEKSAATTPDQRKLLALNTALAEAQYAALKAVVAVEKRENAGDKSSERWKQAAQSATAAQRQQAVAEAERNLAAAQQALAAAQHPAEAKGANTGKPPLQDPMAAQAAQAAAKAKIAEAEKALNTARAEYALPPSTAYKPRNLPTFPTESSGRRLAFARWLTDRQNPLTARVAMNQIWMRHFGVGIVPSVSDFGRNGRPPSHPQLLDWLASEFMAHNWQMKPMHRLIVTSASYRMASTADPDDLKRDPDNTYLWRMNSRRMEAEVVRDNLLYVAGQLDETRGGPEIDHNLGLTSRRRSIYLRHAAEKQAEFLQIFDGPSVTECYERKQSVMPQQALALANSEIALVQSRTLARSLAVKVGSTATTFVREAFLRVLSRLPTAQELQLCTDFLAEQTRRFTTQALKPDAVAARPEDTSKPSADPALHARESLTLVLFNHNDFVTIR